MDVALPGQLSLCLSLSFLGDNPKKLTCPRRLEFPPALRKPEEKNENIVSAGEVVEADLSGADGTTVRSCRVDVE